MQVPHFTRIGKKKQCWSWWLCSVAANQFHWKDESQWYRSHWPFCSGSEKKKTRWISILKQTRSLLLVSSRRLSRHETWNAHISHKTYSELYLLCLNKIVKLGKSRLNCVDLIVSAVLPPDINLHLKGFFSSFLTSSRSSTHNTYFSHQLPQRKIKNVRRVLEDSKNKDGIRYKWMLFNAANFKRFKIHVWSSA